MSSLTGIDKVYLEKILDMASGYVLDFTDETFGSFFRTYGINIHGPKYQTYGTSKARKMRAFWDHGSDSVVALVLGQLLDYYEASCEVNER